MEEYEYYQEEQEQEQQEQQQEQQDYPRGVQREMEIGLIIAHKIFLFPKKIQPFPISHEKPIFDKMTCLRE